MKKKKFLSILAFFPAILLLGGCTETSNFVKGDIKDDFCGPILNYQYCKCAFHNEYCDAVGMKKGEANKYVNDQYDKWIEAELQSWQADCRQDNGVVRGRKCIYCSEGETAADDKCVAADKIAANEEEDGLTDEDPGINEEDKGECKYDSDCDPICEGGTAWKMGCNPRGNFCEKTFDTDCTADLETFGGEQIPKICQAGECVRDGQVIEIRRQELTAEKKMWSDTVKQINDKRADINVAMLEANKNCINGIADMTNVAIVEFATRIGSVLAGGIPDIAKMTASAAEHAAGLAQENMKNLAGAAVDYAGDALQRLYNYQSGEPAEESQKLKPHEYIKLNCDLYEYFKQVEMESATDLQTALDKAEEVNDRLQALP